MFIFSSQLLQFLFHFFFSISKLQKSITAPPSTKPKPTLDSSFSQAPTKRCRERYGKVQYDSNSFVENTLYTSSSTHSKSHRLFFFFFFKSKVRIFFFRLRSVSCWVWSSFFVSLSTVPLILIINIDLLCCSNIDLVLCLKLFGKLK